MENTNSLTWNAGYAYGRMVGSASPIFPYQPMAVGHESLTQPNPLPRPRPLPIAIRREQRVGPRAGRPVLPRELQRFFDEEFETNEEALRYLIDK